MLNTNLKETEEFFFFDAEVSNEDTDLQGQIVLQTTLLTAKNYFLRNGIISVNHRHRKRQSNRIETDARYVVGKPISVYTKGKSTWIRGKLYKDNALARIAIELLRRGSKQVRASIGGLSPVTAIAPDGRQLVIQLFWNDVALTINPVNNSLEPVRGVIKKTIKLAGIKIRKKQIVWPKARGGYHG